MTGELLGMSAALDRCTVVLRPSWLGRLLGRRPIVVELARVVEQSSPTYRVFGDWHSVHTGQRVRELPYKNEIWHAMNFRSTPLTGLPAARLLTRGTP